MSADLPIATVRKGSRESFVISIRDRHGRSGVDLRVHAFNGVTMASTAKGIVIQPALLRSVIEALEKAEREVQALGLIQNQREVA